MKRMVEMKIMIVMGGFFPGKKYGGPPVSIDNFCTLMNEYECYIVTSNHDLFETDIYANIERGWNDRGNCKVLYLSDAEYKKQTFERVISEIQPEIIYLQGLFQKCVFPCLQLSKKYNLNVLIAPRGELCGGALNIKRHKKNLYIEAIKLLNLVKNIYWQSTSEEETAAIIKRMKADKGHIYRVDNIPSIPKEKYTRQEKVAGEGRFIFISRIHPKKNLLKAINLFHNIKETVTFDIYGSIEDEEYWERCQGEIRSLSDNVHVRYKGLVSHDQVHKVFSQYDAFLFPTLSENYGHVIVESLIVGTPVIISDQTPWNDVGKCGAGKVIALDNEEEFINAIKEIILSNNNYAKEVADNSRNYILKKMKIDKLREEYREIFRQMQEGMR